MRQAFRATHQAVELVEHADAASGESGQRGAGDAETRKRAEAENEARIENEIDDVRDPEQTHGDGGVAGPAEDGVVEKQQQHGEAAAEAIRV